MGADSCSSDTHRYSVVNNQKLFRIADKRLLVGIAGSWRMADLLQHSLQVGAPTEGEADRAYVNRIMDQVRTCFRAGGFLHKGEEVESISGAFLLGYRKRIWQVQSDLSVLFGQAWGTAIGSGMDAALGSLYTTRDWDHAERRVEAALAAAEATITTVRGPFHIERLG